MRQALDHLSPLAKRGPMPALLFVEKRGAPSDLVLWVTNLKPVFIRQNKCETGAGATKSPTAAPTSSRVVKRHARRQAVAPY